MGGEEAGNGPIEPHLCPTFCRTPSWRYTRGILYSLVDDFRVCRLLQIWLETSYETQSQGNWHHPNPLRYCLVNSSMLTFSFSILASLKGRSFSDGVGGPMLIVHGIIYGETVHHYMACSCWSVLLQVNAFSLRLWELNTSSSAKNNYWKNESEPQSTKFSNASHISKCCCCGAFGVLYTCFTFYIVVLSVLVHTHWQWVQQLWGICTHLQKRTQLITWPHSTGQLKK